MNENCLHVACKGRQAILRQLGPAEYRPGWWYLFCPRCGMRGPAADNQQDARVLWAAIWAVRTPPEPPQGEAADPDPNADGPAERAHRQDEARRLK
jgi:hypothetical protein